MNCRKPRMNWFELRVQIVTFDQLKPHLLNYFLRSVCWLILCYAGKLTAQQARQYTFTHYSTVSGLLSNQVNTVVQDADGFIWTGTTDGLQRFDGNRYKTFRYNRNDPFSLPSNPVWQVLLDKKKNLWVLLADGQVGIFDTKKFKFLQVAVKTKLEKTITTARKELAADDFGNIFLFIRGGEFLTWNEKANEFSAAHNFIQQKPDWIIHDFVHQTGTQKYWLVITDGSLAIYNHATHQLSYRGNNTEHEQVIDILKEKNLNPYHFYFDKRGRVWFITWGNEGFPSIYCYDLKLNKLVIEHLHFIHELKRYYELHGFFEQNDGTIWIRGMGVFAKYIEQEKKFERVYNGYVNERSISYEMVSALFEDHEKNIWVGTDNNGLYRFNPKAEYFTNLNHINRVTGNKGDGSVMSFIATKWGTLLTGTWGEGIYHYDNKLNPIPTNIKGIDNKIGPFGWSMSASGDSNTIWISAQPGIYAIDQSTRSAKFYNPPVLENRTVRQLQEDKNGNLWLGMQHIGLFKWTLGNNRKNLADKPEQFAAIPRITINKIITDSKGYLWVATSMEGLFVIDPTTDKIILHFSANGTKELKLPDTGVLGVLEYDDSTMVITTSTRVIKYNRLLKQSTYIGQADILSGYIASMEKDKLGYVWLTTTSGLYRINIRKKIFIKFTRSDGITNDRFILAASRYLSDGRMIFGTTNNAVIFNPDSIRINGSSPETKITDFKVMNKSMQIDSLIQLKEVDLEYKENSLVIEFSTLNYSGTSLIKYKLEGLDKDWKFADKNNEAIYNYLPPGTYSFLMKTINEEGVETESKLGLTIKVKPPFWKSWWFYSILVLITGSLIYWFDRERMNRKEGMQKMRTDIADNLHQEINTALNNINILSEMAKLKAENDPKKSKEYIEQIHSRSHNMMIAMDDMLWSIDPENDNMEKTVDRMKEYVDALQNRHGADIEIFVDRKVQSLELNMMLRHEAFLLFKEALKSLVHAGAKKCDIYIGLEKSKLLFTMQFANDSCDIQQLNNLLHRQDMEKRLQSIRAILDVEVHKSNSMFVLQVPVA